MDSFLALNRCQDKSTLCQTSICFNSNIQKAVESLGTSMLRTMEKPDVSCSINTRTAGKQSSFHLTNAGRVMAACSPGKRKYGFTDAGWGCWGGGGGDGRGMRERERGGGEIPFIPEVCIFCKPL